MTKKTKTCEHCRTEFEPAKRGRSPRFCSSACKQRAYRARHAKPVTLEQVTRSQRRADRKHDSPVQRRQQHGGAQDASIREEFKDSGAGSTRGDLVISESDGTRTVLGSAYGKTEVGRTVARFASRSPFPPVEDEALWRASDPYGGVRWDEVYSEAIYEFVSALYRGVRCRNGELAIPSQPWGLPEASRDLALSRWLRKYLTHPDLTIEGRLYVVTRIPEDYITVMKQKEKPVIETVAAQNEEILARLARLQQTADETFARLADTVERVRERFPNDAEVSAAVDRLLEDIGS